jgi:peptide/nickel transport system substrate-binding protein
VTLVGQEPANIAARPLTSAGTSLRFQQRLPNALLAVIDARGLPQPELLSELPRLNSGSWRVFADGTMRTTYSLRPNLVWHDGQPLSSEDFVFAWRVYSSPGLGHENQPPLTHMASVEALDGQHFAITWKRSYPDADNLSYSNREFPALPRHILGAAFDSIDNTGRDAFASNPFWTQGYVGLGPYRIQRWESGSFIEFVGFDRYALGAPKIGRVEMRFGQDANVSVASLLSGAVHMVPSLDSSEVVREEWSRTSGGRFLDRISSFVYYAFQLRPEYVNPTAILDPRVRRATAHLVDKATLVDTIYGGQAIVTETLVWSGSQWGPAVDRSIPSYGIEPRTAERLINEAGFVKGADGFYRGPEGRISAVEVVSTATPDKIQLAEVLADWFKVAGLDTSRRTIPSAQSQDNEVRSTFPGVLAISGTPGDAALISLGSAAIPGPENRWVGMNRGGWSSGDYDRLLTAFSSTLDRGDRVEQVRGMLRIAGEDLPLVPLVFNVGKDAVVAALQGPTNAAPEANTAWNIYEWSLK